MKKGKSARKNLSRGNSNSFQGQTEADSNSAEETPHYPRSKWKWGNGGIVSGNVICKPDYGNFKIIVDSGFNLGFASLMELRKQHGTILFCQLDVTSRYLKDPAATRLADNILEQMSSPHIPAGPVRTAFAGSDSGAKILDRMGEEYTRVSPNDAIRLNAAQAIILDADGKDALHLISGRKPVILLPGFPLETLSGVTLRNTVQDIFRASAPKDDPLFEGIPDADLYFRNASKLPVLTAKPQWTAATEPALFAKVKINARPYIIFNIAPGMVEGFWNGEKISRVWSTIFNNLNIGLSRGILLFGGERMRHNTIIPHLGEAVPENVKLKLDFRNKGKPGQTGGFKPVLLGKSWEEQGFTQKNPFYTLPKETPKQYRNNLYDGYAWYRMEVFIPESWKGATLTLDGGPIDDFDWTWFNGKAIGETTLRNSKAPWSAIRHYPIPQEIVKFGEKNVIEIRVFDRWSGGGIVGPLKLTAKKATAPSRSPYIDNLDFYDGDAFHQW